MTGTAKKPKTKLPSNDLRRKFLEMGSVVNTLLEKRYFPDLVEALESGERSKFEAVCNRAEIPNGARDQLWETLKEVWKANNQQTPWMTGA